MLALFLDASAFPGFTPPREIVACAGEYPAGVTPPSCEKVSAATPSKSSVRAARRLLPRPMNASSPDDLHLLQATAQGDKAAFSQLYDRFAPPVFGLLLRILRSRAEAEEVLQDSFWGVWKQAARFESERGSPFTWVVTIARRKAIDRLRANARHTARIHEAHLSSAHENFTSFTGSEQAETSDTVTAVRTALAQLRPDERAAIQLAFFDGLTHGEIAEALELPVGTVKARIRRGMAKLQRPLSRVLAGGRN